jgi:predicted DNA-binding transcriptional regulator YafY
MSETLSRQWQMLQLIPRSPKSVSVARIHADLQAKGYVLTRRTVERDLLELQDRFSLEVDATQRPQLWSWAASSLPLDLPRMSQSEALTLLMAREYLQPIMPASTMAQMTRYFGLAEQRIKGDTVGSKRILEANWRAKVRVLPSTQPLLSPKVNSEALANTQEGLLRGLQCEVTYQGREASSPDSYAIHPLGLVQRGLLLYVVCTIKHYSDIILLAVHRVQTATLSAHAVKVPLGFDLDAYIATGVFGWDCDSRRVELKARFTSEAALHLRETPLSKDQSITDESRGHVLVTASVQLTQQLVWWLLGFGDGVEVLEPLVLRAQMAASIQRAAEKYA